MTFALGYAPNIKDPCSIEYVPVKLLTFGHTMVMSYLTLTKLISLEASEIWLLNLKTNPKYKFLDDLSTKVMFD